MSPPAVKSCTKCGDTKPLDEFPRDRSRRDGRFPRCRRCNSQNVREWAAANPEHARRLAREGAIRRRANGGLGQRAARLKYEYGLSVEQFDAMVAEQGGVCAICGDPPDHAFLHVDHDHETGEIRGLLCRSCNWTLGMSRDDPDRLEAAAAYLRRRR